MAYQKKFSEIKNTGFGSGAGMERFRLTNKDGSNNLRKTGLHIWEHISIYHTLLRMSRNKFLLLVFVFYTSINLIFAFIYCGIGIHHLSGVSVTNNFITNFLGAFFFSSQTLTTVGYGHVAPDGLVANTIASIESLIGILSFAVVTGLIYGRFSRPRAYLMFSHNMLVAPYKDGRALMVRTATFKNNHLTDAEAMLTVALQVEEDGKLTNKFYQLPLEVNKVNSLALSWTLVHALDDKSPLQNYTKEDFIKSKLEIIVNVKAFDDHFSNIVQQRTSYTYRELQYGAKFLPMFHISDDGMYTVLEIDKINAHQSVPVPEAIPVEA